MKLQFDVAIIGGGIIGVSIADELSKNNYRVVILEKNYDVAQETSEGNSGVIHGGFDANPSKINARLNVEGRKIYEKNLFKELDFPHKKINSLVLAFNSEEIKELEILRDRGVINGVKSEDLKIINQEEIIKLEPNINPKVKKALLCTCSYVVNPVLLTTKLLERAKQYNTKIYFNHKVNKINFKDKEFIIECENRPQLTFHSKFIINAAGHYADEISSLIEANDFKLTSRRGQYSILNQSEQKRLQLNHVIFLVPTKYGKGVIVAPTLDGYVLVGPTAVENVSKESTRLIDFNQLPFIAKQGKKIIPSISMEKVVKVMSGSRPIDLETDDFIINYSSNNNHFINVAGIKSPGLSAAPAIALEVLKLIRKVE